MFPNFNTPKNQSKNQPLQKQRKSVVEQMSDMEKRKRAKELGTSLALKAKLYNFREKTIPETSIPKQNMREVLLVEYTKKFRSPGFIEKMRLGLVASLDADSGANRDKNTFNMYDKDGSEWFNDRFETNGDGKSMFNSIGENKTNIMDRDTFAAKHYEFRDEQYNLSRIENLNTIRLSQHIFNFENLQHSRGFSVPTLDQFITKLETINSEITDTSHERVRRSAKHRYRLLAFNWLTSAVSKTTTIASAHFTGFGVSVLGGAAIETAVKQKAKQYSEFLEHREEAGIAGKQANRHILSFFSNDLVKPIYPVEENVEQNQSQPLTISMIGNVNLYRSRYNLLKKQGIQTNEFETAKQKYIESSTLLLENYYTLKHMLEDKTLTITSSIWNSYKILERKAETTEREMKEIGVDVTKIKGNTNQMQTLLSENQTQVKTYIQEKKVLATQKAFNPKSVLKEYSKNVLTSSLALVSAALSSIPKSGILSGTQAIPVDQITQSMKLEEYTAKKVANQLAKATGLGETNPISQAITSTMGKAISSVGTNLNKITATLSGYNFNAQFNNIKFGEKHLEAVGKTVTKSFKGLGEGGVKVVKKVREYSFDKVYGTSQKIINSTLGNLGWLTTGITTGKWNQVNSEGISVATKRRV
jgi:hypothetical protein